MFNGILKWFEQDRSEFTEKVRKIMGEEYERKYLQYDDSDESDDSDTILYDHGDLYNFKPESFKNLLDNYHKPDLNFHVNNKHLTYQKHCI